MASSEVQIVVNFANLEKIKTFLNTESYRDLIENSETFNQRLCIERRLRMPFLDPQTGVAQNHSQLFHKKQQRMPGLREGQIYTYPSTRWRKARRQYLINPRPFGRPVREDFEETTHIDGSSLGAGDTDSKDSQKEEPPKEWYYDEADMNSLDDFDEPDPDSDCDYEEPYHFKRQRRTAAKKARGSGRGEGGGREYGRPRGGRGSRGSRRGNRANMSPFLDAGSPSSSLETPSTSTASAGGRNSRGRQSLPPFPPPHSFTAPPPMPLYETDPQMPVLLPEQKPPEDPDDKLLPPAHYIRKPPEKGKAPPSPYCDFCLGDSRENKKTQQPEDLVSCSDCGRSGHPTCLQFTKNMIVSVKKYKWQCIECKYCSICFTSDNDDQLLFCDDCDRGYHMYCLAPPLTIPPEGSWSCKLCTEEFHGGKKVN